MALTDAQYQALSPADIAQHATDGKNTSAHHASIASDSSLAARWNAAATLYESAFVSETWPNLKAADLAADAAFAAETSSPGGGLSLLAPPAFLEPLPSSLATPWTPMRKAAAAAAAIAAVAITAWLVA